MRRALFSLCFLFVCVAPAFANGTPGQPGQHGKIRIATKPFTESYVLAEMVAVIVDDAGEAMAKRGLGLGGPTMAVDALTNGSVDIDVNYTGSLQHLFLKDKKDATLDEIRQVMQQRGVTLSESLGFNNTYAIAVRAETAKELGLEKVSDLRTHPELRGAFTPDFLNYDDGFYKLEEFYGIKLALVRPMQHALAYQALQSREIDLTDAYTTDGTLGRLHLTLLTDDKGFFPKYYGVIAIRTEITTRYPKTWAALRRLEGRISDAQMMHVNGLVDNKQASIEEAARGFLRELGLLKNDASSTAAVPARAAARLPAVLDAGLWTATYEHLTLVLISLFLSCLFGIPLGIITFHYRRFGHVLIGVTGLLQTVPSMALLCFLIPLLGIGALPTIFALFIYGLLPIVQSTASGLLSLDPKLTETARILGLGRMQRLRLIELPLASINILAGIKTAAVINVATATIAALIGAGGYGRYIIAGLGMNDIPTLLKGAVPTALMAVGFHALFELCGRFIIPKGLRT